MKENYQIKIVLDVTSLKDRLRMASRRRRGLLSGYVSKIPTPVRGVIERFDGDWSLTPQYQHHE